MTSSQRFHNEDTLKGITSVFPNKKNRVAMDELLRCRNMEAMCRQRAMYDTQRGWEWLANAEKWKELADKEALTSEESAAATNDRFQKADCR